MPVIVFRCRFKDEHVAGVVDLGDVAMDFIRQAGRQAGRQARQAAKGPAEVARIVFSGRNDISLRCFTDPCGDNEVAEAFQDGDDVWAGDRLPDDGLDFTPDTAMHSSGVEVEVEASEPGTVRFRFDAGLWGEPVASPRMSVNWLEQVCARAPEEGAGPR
jgi:hypothetical protein